MVAELFEAVAGEVGDYLDEEKNRWWVQPLKFMLYAAAVLMAPVYLYFY